MSAALATSFPFTGYQASDLTQAMAAGLDLYDHVMRGDVAPTDTTWVVELLRREHPHLRPREIASARNIAIDKTVVTARRPDAHPIAAIRTALRLLEQSAAGALDRDAVHAEISDLFEGVLAHVAPDVGSRS